MQVLHQDFIRYPKCPFLPNEPVISFPCLVQGCHWVAVTGRVIDGNVYIFYSDDLNDPSLELSIRKVLSSSNDVFYPPSSHWITCSTLAYYPHYNECAIRTLLALLIHALHPNPSSMAFTKWMHPNLPIICRTWIATCLLKLNINTAAIQHLLSDDQQLPTSPTMAAIPRYLVTWGPPSPLFPNIRIPLTPCLHPKQASPLSYSPSALGSSHSSRVAQLRCTAQSSLNPEALPFLPSSGQQASI